MIGASIEFASFIALFQAVFLLLLSSGIEANRWHTPKLPRVQGQSGADCLVSRAGSTDPVPIGWIQGDNDSSPCVGQIVAIQGVVTGIREDRNLEGIDYYTFFVQDLPEMADGDPATSDGISVFTGRTPPQIAIGDLVQISGTVQEYYGLTEIDAAPLQISVVAKDYELPTAIDLDPPTSSEEARIYFERYEGMLAEVDSGIVVGPTHSGCGFAIVREESQNTHIIAQSSSTPIGHVINVLNWSDAQCNEFLQLFNGQRVGGISGPITFDFDQFKIVQSGTKLITVPAAPAKSAPKKQNDELITMATFNLNDFPADIQQSDYQSDVQETIDLAKFTKIAYAISEILQCPSLIALQEVHHKQILIDLANELGPVCGFRYEVIHIEGPDIRGIENALMINPIDIEVRESLLRQTCTPLPTEYVDISIRCADEEWPLYSRPPLQVELEIDGVPATVFVIHLKSKRGGADSTAPLRLAQAEFLRQIIDESLLEAPDLPVIALGDFNDFEESAAADTLVSDGTFINLLSELPTETRYSYNFGGVSQLVDWIIVSAGLNEVLAYAEIAHVNADYPQAWSVATDKDKIGYRSSDHDIPVVAFRFPRPIISTETTPSVERASPTSVNAPTSTSSRSSAQEYTQPARIDEDEVDEKTEESDFTPVIVIAAGVLISAVGIGLYRQGRA